MIVYYFFKLVEIIFIIRIILSWINPDPYHPVTRFFYTVTEPVLEPIRRLLPTNSFGIDFSPIIVFLILGFLERLFLGGYYY